MTLNRRDLLLATGSTALAGGGMARSQARSSLIYENPLASETDIAGFTLEGQADISFTEGRMVMENALPPEEGQRANYVLWCPETFPPDIEVSWSFEPLREPGLCVFFFGAAGRVDGEPVSVLDPRLSPRQGLYDQYTSSDVFSLQLSYFRRRWEEERRFHLVNLRAAPGFELLAQGADPLPGIADIDGPYRLAVRKQGARITFAMDDLVVMDWTAPDGRPLPGAGSIGFRQMAPLRAAYADLTVRRLS